MTFFTFWEAGAKYYAAVGSDGIMKFLASQVELEFYFDGEPGETWAQYRQSKTLGFVTEVSHDQIKEVLELWISSLTGIYTDTIRNGK